MASEREKVSNPGDRVLTPEQKSSYPVGAIVAISVLAIGLLFASLYFGILNP